MDDGDDRARGRDRRGRTGGDDAGGRAGSGGHRRGGRRAAAGPRAGRLARRRLHSRTIEVLDQRGVAERFLAAGQTVQVFTFGTTTLDIGDFPTRHPYALGLWQNEIERIMAAWVAELPVPFRYGSEVAGFAQDDAGVDVALSDGGSLRARYLVGCDGGRSLIRRAAGIDFPGWDADTQQPDRRGRDDRGAAELGHPPRRATASTPWAGSSTRSSTAGRLRGRRAGPRDTERGAPRCRRPHAGRSPRGADRRLRDRLRGPQPDLAVAVHGRDPAGGALPRGTGAAGGRRGPRALPGRWAGARHSACRTR